RRACEGRAGLVGQRAARDAVRPAGKHAGRPPLRGAAGGRRAARDGRGAPRRRRRGACRRPPDRDLERQRGGSMSATDANVQAVGRERYGLDVASAEVLAFALHNTSVQMHRALMRSAFSAVVRDVMDCTSSINVKTPHGWETVAEMGPSLHAPVSGHVCNFVLEEYGEENLRKGDVLIHNDPWRGAVHQSDVSILRGVFVDGELTFVLESCSHLVDMGGPVAGGYPTGARYTFEENLRIPPSLLYAEDVPVRGMFNMLLESTRVPQLNLGDLRALYGSVVVGER